MSRAEPTEGEWAYERGTIRTTRADGLGRNIAETIRGSSCGPSGSFHVGREEADANGRLFAASKDLLAACEAALKWATYWDTNEQAKRDADTIRAAIAKAKGEP